jgi:hypothetical protein
VGAGGPPGPLAYVRGWRVPYISPTIDGVMALLQMDMLAYSEEADGRSAIVIGAGVPAEAERPAAGEGRRCRTGGSTRVERAAGRSPCRAPLPSARLGPSFPADTPLQWRSPLTPGRGAGLSPAADRIG